MESKVVVVAGAAGKLGTLVVRELSTRGAKVRAIVRDAARSEARGLVELGADVVTLDVARATGDALAGVVRGAFAVVSTMQGGPDVIVEAQLALLAAARTERVRRLLPSAYSFNFFTLPEGVNVNSDWRRELALRARDLRGDVEVVHVMQGMFADAGVAGFVDLYDREKNALRFWGDGHAPIDWTTWEDTAKYIAAAALDDRPVPEQLFVAGDRMSVRELADALGAIRGAPTVDVLGTLVDLRAEIERRRRTEPGNMYAWLPLMYALGAYGGEALLGPIANDRYPEIRPESVRDAIARGAL